MAQTQITIVECANNANLVDLGKKLLDACKNGETEEVRNLMQNGAPFTTDWLGTSPLHFAAHYGHAETTDVLLRSGVSRDTRTKVERTPLHVASQEGHLGIVNLLLIHGADVDARDLLRMTPLHWAVERGHTDVVECLLTNGADVNLQSKFDKSPIDLAIDIGRTDLLPTLKKYINSSKPKQHHEAKSSTIQSIKAKPTVLPNKAIKTAKIINKSSPSGGSVKQMIFSSGSAHQKTISFEGLKRLISGRNGEVGDSADLLATLASIAGNNAGNMKQSNSHSDPDAVQWLESHMAATSNENDNDDSTIQLAIERGQSVNLTEAGKQALNSIKSHQSGSASTSSATPQPGNPIKMRIVQPNSRTPLEVLVGQLPFTAKVMSGQQSHATSSAPTEPPNAVSLAIAKQSTPVLIALKAAIEQELDKRERKGSSS